MSRVFVFSFEKISKLFLLDGIYLGPTPNLPRSLHTKPTIGAVARSFCGPTTAIFRHIFRRFACGFVLLWMPTALWAQNQEAPAADVTQMSTGELEKKASLLVGTQKYPEAVPLLSELLTRLGETKEPQLQAKVESFDIFWV